MAKYQKLIDVQTLNSLLQNKDENIRILDCTYASHTPPEFKNLDEFNKKLYGNILELFKIHSPNRDTYLAAHIPTSVHIDINIATCPKPYEPWALYEGEVFEKYAQFLGINANDHLILYGRGLFGGMLWAGKIYWLLKTYGHDNISILNGGLAAWQSAGFSVETLKEFPKIQKGNWKAHFRPELIATFEDVVQYDPPNSTNLFELGKKFNIIDCRFRAQYEGTEDTGYGPKVTGSYVPGTKCVPFDELIDGNGYLKSEEEINQKLKHVNVDPNKPTITMCNLGTAGSLMAFILDNFVHIMHPLSKTRVYNGSMKEIEARDPKKISGGTKRKNTV